MTGSHEVRGSIPLGSTNICNTVKGIHIAVPCHLCAYSVPASRYVPSLVHTHKLWPSISPDVWTHTERHWIIDFDIATGLVQHVGFRGRARIEPHDSDRMKRVFR